MPLASVQKNLKYISKGVSKAINQAQSLAKAQKEQKGVEISHRID